MTQMPVGYVSVANCSLPRFHSINIFLSIACPKRYVLDAKLEKTDTDLAEVARGARINKAMAFRFDSANIGPLVAILKV
jgi:hypothetical protein